MKRLFIFLSMLIVALPVVSAQTGQTDLALLTATAESGDAKAQNGLAIRYYNGDGVVQSYEQAAIWLKNRRVRAMLLPRTTWVLCMKRKRRTSDYARALQWYTMAANQGHAAAQANVAWFYENGFGTAQNYDEAFKWYQESAAQGYAYGQYSVGWFYDKGLGVAEDNTQAVQWYTLAAEQGLPEAQYMLGLMYENGDGVAVDFSQAFHWYNEAAEGESPEAMLALGFFYEFGISVDEDIVQALAWYMIASDYGNKDAASYVEDLSKDLSEQEIDAARQMADDF